MIEGGDEVETPKILVSELTSAIKHAAFYLKRKGRPGGISGQMVTSWTCIGCGHEFTHANTSTPVLCETCSNILAHCAAILTKTMCYYGHNLPFEIHDDTVG
jgi:ribosomal protein S27E